MRWEMSEMHECLQKGIRNAPVIRWILVGNDSFGIPAGIFGGRVEFAVEEGDGDEDVEVAETNVGDGVELMSVGLIGAMMVPTGTEYLAL